MTKKPHKHSEFIKAWADGAEIEIYEINHDQWIPCFCPSWIEGCKYRIKPEPKPDVVQFWCASCEPVKRIDLDKNLKLTFDGETGQLKSAEVLT